MLFRDEIDQIYQNHINNWQRRIQKTVSMSLKPPTKIDLHKSFDENDTTNKSISRKVSLSSITIPAYTVADLQVATKSFSADNLVSEGRFGRVYRAQLCDQKVCSVTFFSKTYAQ